MRSTYQLGVLSLAVATLALAGCGGGLGASGPAIGGFYVGTAVSNSTTLGVRGLIDENGEAGFIEFNCVPSSCTGSYSVGSLVAVIVPNTISSAAGTLNTNALTLDVPYTEYPAGGGTSSGTLAGSFVSRTSITGSLTGGVSLNLSSTSNYFTGHSLAAIAGNYTFSYTKGSTTDTATITLSPTGAISTKSSNNGCVYSGSFTIPDPAYDGFELSFTDTCDAALTGVAAFFPAASSSPAELDLILHDASEAQVLKLLATA